MWWFTLICTMLFGIETMVHISKENAFDAVIYAIITVAGIMCLVSNS